MITERNNKDDLRLNVTKVYHKQVRGRPVIEEVAEERQINQDNQMIITKQGEITRNTFMHAYTQLF